MIAVLPVAPDQVQNASSVDDQVKFLTGIGIFRIGNIVCGDRVAIMQNIIAPFSTPRLMVVAEFARGCIVPDQMGRASGIQRDARGGSIGYSRRNRR